jgi:UDP-N-acetylmuramoylalanine--D-glutamate ligase
MEHYAALKERLAMGARLACIAMDDDLCRAVAARRLAAHRPTMVFAAQHTIDVGYALTGDRLVALSGGDHPAREIACLAGLSTLRGLHNAQNALAAIAAVEEISVRAGCLPDVDWQTALATYPGLPHRLEEIGRLGRVLFINDSKATNADSAATALAAFERDIFWILGGKPKEGGINTLKPFFPRIAKAYLIGEASEEFAATLGGKVAFERCDTLDVALAAATRDAGASAAAGRPEPVVLLSPACASYDQYPNFEVRGDRFRTLVAALPGIALRGSRK